jgi:hypothetical protein
MTDTTTLTSLPPRRYEAPKRVSHKVFLRELTMVDGRKIFVDKRALAFLAEGKPGDFNGKKATIVAFKSWTKGVPVVEGYNDLKAWWLSGAE